MDIEPTLPVLMMTLTRGWQKGYVASAHCRRCSTTYSNSWSFQKGESRGVSISDPSKQEMFQVVAHPRAGGKQRGPGKVFVQVQVLLALRSLVIRAKCGFDALADFLTDLHGHGIDNHDRTLLLNAWILFDVLHILWTANATEFLKTQVWHVTARHDAAELREDFKRAEPALATAFASMHAQHLCSLCADKTVAFDVKQSIACQVCNHRDAGHEHIDALGATVMFGCENAPLPRSSYCKEHKPPQQAPEFGYGDAVIKHKDVDGQRRYQMERSRGWCSKEQLPDGVVKEYEASLLERELRRKRRRKHWVTSADAVRQPEDDQEAPFFDTSQVELRLLPDDDNPCGLDKSHAPRRRYGGLLVATLPCGRVVGLKRITGGESLTQVYALLAEICKQRPVKYVIYNNACALARHVRNPVRSVRTATATLIASMTFVIDRFHNGNHTACLDPAHAQYLPEVDIERYDNLREVNSATQEQFNSWIDRYSYVVAKMHPVTYRIYVLLVAYWYNEMICAKEAPEIGIAALKGKSS